MDLVNLSDFQKLNFRVGRIVEVHDILGKDKLYKLIVDLGEPKYREILAGIKPWYSKEELLERLIIVVANLEPKKIGDLNSEGMLLCAEDENGGCVLLMPCKEVKVGAKVR